MIPGPVAQVAAYVHGGTGTRFRLVSEPSEGKPLGTVIAVHAFAEEMNKSRRMCARMARLMAQNGWRVVQKDLLGCGDSPGDFSDASWAGWVADVEEELQQADTVGPVWLWGLRAGALLCSAVLPGRPQVNLLLWQPTTSGAQHLQQFLRLHAGARIVGSAKSDVGDSPAQRLRSGLCVEVGGYELAPGLASGMEKAKLDVPPDHAGRVVWFEVSSDAAPDLSPATTRVVERLRERAIDVAAHALTGPAFWHTQEIEECEALLRESLAALSQADRSTRSDLQAFTRVSVAP
jgi:uncharacterized protein